jgi:FMNH2-dependent dimethyl sulfone monooxygenase
VSALKAKLGIYIPVYGGWLRGVNEVEKRASYLYASETASLAEGIGIQSIWIPDHMLNPIKDENADSLEAWTLLTALAVETERVELFHTTLCQSFRYPAVLAKMCVTLDEISDGRFRFALGAGWFKREFQAYGVPWSGHDDRIERSREQIQIIKSLWTEPKTNYMGRFYEIVDGVLEPKPLQKPHPPIWWGGESEKSRQLTADLADGWLMRSSTIKEAEKKINDMKGRLEKNGRANIKYALPGRIFLGDTDQEAENQVKGIVQENPSLLEPLLKRGFIGSPENISEKINALSDIGVDYIILQASPALKTLKEIEETLLPIL